MACPDMYLYGLMTILSEVSIKIFLWAIIIFKEVLKLCISTMSLREEYLMGTRSVSINTNRMACNCPVTLGLGGARWKPLDDEA